ncbi:hypothetical protein ACVWW6_009097 [Bradyrhizobium sp. USDA 3311]
MIEIAIGEVVMRAGMGCERGALAAGEPDGPFGMIPQV